jgi:hypothetical protein
MILNKFDVLIWVRETVSFPALRDELIRLAGNEPDESTSYEGMVDFHWGFVDLADAEHIAAALSQMASDIVLLRHNCRRRAFHQTSSPRNNPGTSARWPLYAGLRRG